MSDTRKILILYADAGFGHRSAALAVEAALKDNYPDECQVEMVNVLEDRRAPSLLRESQSDYDKIVRSVPELYKLGYQASDAVIPSTIAESALTLMLFEVIHDLIKRYNPDAIVTTYPLYQAPLEAVFTILRRFIPVLTVVTDLVTVHRLWFNETIESCLVPTARVRDLAIDAGLQPGQIQITGIPVHPNVVKETRPQAEIRAELGWHSDLSTVLAVGSRRVERLLDMLQVLNHSGLPLQLAVVAGGDNDLYEALKKEEWHAPTHIYNYVENIPTMMHASDMIMCKAGGLITTESLACGLPMILTQAIPGQETGNARFVIDGGAGEMAETPVAVLQTVFHWLQNDGHLLAAHAKNAEGLGRPNAAYVVADLAWNAAHNGGQRKSRYRLGRPKLIDMLRTNHIPWV